MKIAAMPGDGIGPEIVGATMEVLERAASAANHPASFEVVPCGLEALERYGSTLPEVTIDALPSFDGWLLGPVSHHTYPADDPRYVNPSAYLRTRFELFANIRPAVSLPGVACLQPDVDVAIVRENTEGFYADRNLHRGSGEFMPSEDMVMSLRVVSRNACLRIARQAFELARQRDGLKRVSAVHKANVLRMGCGLFLEACKEVAADYPDIDFDDHHVDAFAFKLLKSPQAFDVVVTTNMFGDILSNVAAGLVGSLGVAPGLNIGKRFAMAQAAHGSAPDIAQRRTGNPVAMILSAVLLLRWLSARGGGPGLSGLADRVQHAVTDALAAGHDVTPDLGGSARTSEMAEAIAARV